MGGVEIVPFPLNGQAEEISDAELQASDPAIDPTERLKTVLSEVRRAREDLDRCRYLADTLPSGTPDDIILDYERRTRNAYRRWYDAQAQAVGLEQETRRRKLESLSLYLRAYEGTLDSRFRSTATWGRSTACWWSAWPAWTRASRLWSALGGTSRLRSLRHSISFI
jgi:hypothetical protein